MWTNVQRCRLLGVGLDEIQVRIDHMPVAALPIRRLIGSLVLGTSLVASSGAFSPFPHSVNPSTPIYRSHGAGFCRRELPGASSRRAPFHPVLTLQARVQNEAQYAAESEAAAALVLQCAKTRDVPASQVVAALEQLERAPCTTVCEEDLGGRHELIFSSAIAKVPLVKGYMPNTEIITFDFQEKRLTLLIETLPFLPQITVIGDDLRFDPSDNTATYRTGNKDKKSVWQFFHCDGLEGVVAARSSVTGLNIIRLVSS
jgi:hypothetical protein